MIDGVDLNKIEMNDYYRRFLILKAILTQAQHMETTLQDTYPSYVQLYNNVVELEETVRDRTSKYNLKNYQYNLTLQQIDLQQQKYIPLVQTKRSTYESDLIKKWRSIINLKQSNDEKMQLEKESKGTANKNLMFLASEIMKNERISKIKLEESKLKIEKLAQQTEQKMKLDNEELQSKCKQMTRLLEKQKQKQKRLTQEINIGFYQKKKKLLQEHNKLMNLLRQELKEEKQEAERNERDIELMFEQLNRNLHGS